MKLKHLIAAAALVALPLTATAATFVVPVAGTGSGANNSQWQSELTLHTSGPRAMTLQIEYHQGTLVYGPVSVTLQPRETISIADVVRTKFDVTSGSGALLIQAEDRDARTLAITSRTFDATVDFGQDIPSVDAESALRAGDIAVLNAPSDAATTRFNFGIYAVTASNVTWELVHADGSFGNSVQVSYAAGQHMQYNGGIKTLLGADAAGNDVVEARLTEGRAIFYGSAINATGDPTFVPGIRTRDDININFLGVDLDENGTVDIADANGDGVADARVQVITSAFPNYFRVVAEGEFGESVQLEVVSSPATTAFLDGNGTLRVIAEGALKNSTGDIVVRATVDGSTTLLTIPVQFR